MFQIFFIRRKNKLDALTVCLIFLFFSTSIIITIIVSVPCIGNLMIEMVLLIIVEIVTIIIRGGHVVSTIVSQQESLELNSTIGVFSPKTCSFEDIIINLSLITYPH